MHFARKTSYSKGRTSKEVYVPHFKRKHMIAVREIREIREATSKKRGKLARLTRLRSSSRFSKCSYGGGSSSDDYLPHFEGNYSRVGCSWIKKSESSDWSDDEVEPKIKTEIEPKIKPKIETEIEPKIEDEIEPKIEADDDVPKVDFIKSVAGFHINGFSCENHTIVTKESDDCVKVRPAIPSEWSAVQLAIGAEYSITAKPFDRTKFERGNMLGMKLIANFRFTAGSEILRGEYDGYAVTGMFYSSARKRFEMATHDKGVDAYKAFTIRSGNNCTTVNQDVIDLLHIRNPTSREEQRYLFPTLCFKNCEITITWVKPIALFDPNFVYKSN